jgi:hypothetical protein
MQARPAGRVVRMAAAKAASNTVAMMPPCTLPIGL